MRYLLCYTIKILTKTIPHPDFVIFLSVNVIPMLKAYMDTKCERLLVEMLVFVSFMVREQQFFNKKILETNIIMKLKEWLS